MKTDALNLNPRHPPCPECGEGAREEADASEQGLREQSVRPVSATFRNILLVVSLLLVFAAVQMFTLWRVCQGGMKTAATLERQGLPTLDALASLQEDLAIYRLRSYEYLFARDARAQIGNFQHHCPLILSRPRLPNSRSTGFALRPQIPSAAP